MTDICFSIRAEQGIHILEMFAVSRINICVPFPNVFAYNSCPISIYSYKKFRCPSRLKTNGKDEIIGAVKPHSHLPDHGDIVKQQIALQIKQSSITNADSSRRSVVCRSLQMFDTEAVSGTLPSTKSMLEKVSRERKRNDIGCGFTHVREIVFTRQMAKFTEYDDFLLFDSGPSDERTFVFASRFGAEMLKNSPEIFIDRTFDAAPRGFEQLVSVHGRFFNSSLNSSFPKFISFHCSKNWINVLPWRIRAYNAQINYDLQANSCCHERRSWVRDRANRCHI